ncbi:arabinogalactan protein 41-like [Juglans microcarpa x Juglans regia]|uniref:arabinogalactan protein 41-like n=1 Tax=Juglans microcarpa x Juglans regia TaxID=2249226 RepID=UPI001B7E0E9F|nr:arabinogalactan protein 41-like [Juglans microcarpa x Juglans regia]
MAVSKVSSFGVVAIIFVIILQMAQAQSPAPAPAPTSDGASIDQGIAYVLMVLALALTYIIH